MQQGSESDGKQVVVVGGGWAGLGAARHLSSQGYKVTLIDAAKSLGGTPWKTESGRTMEAGMKGLWRQYNNIFSLLDDIGIDQNSTLTDWTGSSFWSKRGLEVDYPTLGNKKRLPSPLGQFLYTLPTFKEISVRDRLSLWRLIYSVIDYQSDYEKYDKMSVHQLFTENGVSPELYETLIRPLLLAMLFAPPEELSAAAIIGTFLFLAMGHQDDFDVKWCKGPVSEVIFGPLVCDIEANGGKVMPSTPLVDLEVDDAGCVKTVVAKSEEGGEVRIETDAVVMCVGVNSIKQLVSSIGALGEAEEMRRVCNLRSSDCIATRIWFDKRVETRSPSNVIADTWPDVGLTFFNLNDLHKEYSPAEENSVVAMDLYNTASLMALSDDEIVSSLHRFLSRSEPGFRNAKIVDFAVVRAPQCATLFSPGSYRHRPSQVTSIPNLVLAGDFVKENPRHGADGLSQERALVTGLFAANKVIHREGMGRPATIIPVDEDEPQIAAAKALNAFAKANPLIDFPPSGRRPLLFARRRRFRRLRRRILF